MSTRAAALLGLLGAAPAAAIGLGARTSATACQCIEWQEVYEQKLAVCGQGLEFFGQGADGIEANVTGFAQEDARLVTLQNDLGTKVCAEFYQHLNGNFATKIKYRTDLADMDKWYANSWCYVSSTCAELHGGQLVPGSTLAWKVAKPGKENNMLLEEMDPEDIINWGSTFGYDLDTLTGFSYFHAQGTDPAKVTKELLKKGVDSMKPTVLLAAPGNGAARQIVKNYAGHGYNLWDMTASKVETKKPQQRWDLVGVDTR